MGLISCIYFPTDWRCLPAGTSRTFQSALAWIRRRPKGLSQSPRGCSRRSPIRWSRFGRCKKIWQSIFGLIFPVLCSCQTSNDENFLTIHQTRFLIWWLNYVLSFPVTGPQEDGSISRPRPPLSNHRDTTRRWLFSYLFFLKKKNTICLLVSFISFFYSVVFFFSSLRWSKVF